MGLLVLSPNPTLLESRLLWGHVRRRSGRRRGTLTAHTHVQLVRQPRERLWVGLLVLPPHPALLASRLRGCYVRLTLHIVPIERPNSHRRAGAVKPRLSLHRGHVCEAEASVCGARGLRVLVGPYPALRPSPKEGCMPPLKGRWIPKTKSRRAGGEELNRFPESPLRSPLGLLRSPPPRPPTPPFGGPLSPWPNPQYSQDNLPQCSTFGPGPPASCSAG